MYIPCCAGSYLRRNLGVCVSAPPRPRKPKMHKNRKRRALLLADDPFCFYCRIPLTLDDSTLDHCIPKSKGGSSRMHNLVLACQPCNVDKADKVYIKRGA